MAYINTNSLIVFHSTLHNNKPPMIAKLFSQSLSSPICCKNAALKPSSLVYVHLATNAHRDLGNGINQT